MKREKKKTKTRRRKRKFYDIIFSFSPSFSMCCDCECAYVSCCRCCCRCRNIHRDTLPVMWSGINTRWNHNIISSITASTHSTPKMWILYFMKMIFLSKNLLDCFRWTHLAVVRIHTRNAHQITPLDDCSHLYTRLHFNMEFRWCFLFLSLSLWLWVREMMERTTGNGIGLLTSSLLSNLNRLMPSKWLIGDGDTVEAQERALLLCIINLYAFGGRINIANIADMCFWKRPNLPQTHADRDFYQNNRIEHISPTHRSPFIVRISQLNASHSLPRRIFEFARRRVDGKVRMRGGNCDGNMGCVALLLSFVGFLIGCHNYSFLVGWPANGFACANTHAHTAHSCDLWI